MTRRENYIRMLNGEKHDRLPACMTLDIFNYPQPLPEILDIQRVLEYTDFDGFNHVAEYVEAEKFCGLDTVIRAVPSTVCISNHNFKVTTVQEAGGERIIYSGKTGEMTSFHVTSKDGGTVFQTEHCVKEVEQYETLIEYFEQQQTTLVPEHVRRARQDIITVGDEGIVYAVTPNSPVMDIARVWTGLENFIYHEMDEPKLMQRVLRTMEECYARQVEMIAANTPCKYLVCWDDSNSLYLSPELFEQYAAPALKRFSDIAHKYGKKYICHTCGSINQLAASFLQSGVDAIDWVTAAPGGDVIPAELQQLWGDRITIMLAPSPGVLRHGTPNEVRAHIHTILKGVDLTGRISLMLPAPKGTPLENAAMAVRILTDEYGVELNRSEKYGSILDPGSKLVYTDVKPIKAGTFVSE